MALRLILSGGIGAGKSAVAGMLAERGAEIVDADSLGHATLEPNGEAYAAVAHEWPDVIHDGRIDRRALGRVVFADEAQLRRLEAIMHPAIRARVDQRVADSDAAVIVVELPIPRNLLGEGWHRVIVDAPDDVRRSRLRARGLDEAEIADRMTSQPSREQWVALADDVIENGGTLDELAGAVDAFWHRTVCGDRVET